MSYQNAGAPDPAPQQPQTQPQQPQFAPQPQYQQPTGQPISAPGYAPYGSATPQPAPQRERVNVLGIVALAVLTVLMLLSFITPLLYRQAAWGGQLTIITTVLPIAQVAVMLIALGLAIGGVLQRSATRFRWAAVGALVSAALSLLSTVSVTLGGLLASALPY
ncbi:MAG: hypothetical protein ACK5LO_15450 [Leucobacter sp.]